MNTGKARTLAQRRSRSALTWVDLLVIAAITVTFAAIVSTTIGRARASTYSSTSVRLSVTPTVPDEINQPHIDAGLMKARLRLAQGGPWN